MRMRDELESELPGNLLLSDLEGILNEAGRKVVLGELTVIIPSGSRLEIVTRSKHANEVDFGMGNHYRALIAVGGIREIKSGVVRPHICFVTMWYSPTKKLITTDFSNDMY